MIMEKYMWTWVSSSNKAANFHFMSIHITILQFSRIIFVKFSAGVYRRIVTSVHADNVLILHMKWEVRLKDKKGSYSRN
jgi:hypothetical protein